MSLDFAGDAEDEEGHGGGGDANTEVGSIRINGEVANECTALKNMGFGTARMKPRIFRTCHTNVLLLPYPENSKKGKTAPNV